MRLVVYCGPESTTSHRSGGARGGGMPEGFSEHAATAHNAARQEMEMGTLHELLKVIMETKTLEMHVHYLTSIRNAISLLVAGTSCGNG